MKARLCFQDDRVIIHVSVWLVVDQTEPPSLSLSLPCSFCLSLSVTPASGQAQWLRPDFWPTRHDSLLPAQWTSVLKTIVIAHMAAGSNACEIQAVNQKVKSESFAFLIAFFI